MFSTEDEICHVLVNREIQYSLWPVAIAVPAGWKVEYGPHPRKQCLAYIDEHWIDMRPKSLADRMREDSARLRRQS